MKSLRLLCLLLVLPITSCEKLSLAIHDGNGKITTDTRNPGEFHSVDLEGAYTVTIVQGPESEVRIETDQNLLQNITTTIKNGELKISLEVTSSSDHVQKHHRHYYQPELQRG